MSSQGRSVVFYVWDNKEQKLVALYRAVRPEDLDRKCAPGFAGYFTLERLNDFVAGLHKTFEPDRYTVRDWIASSVEDFHITRFGWTKQDFDSFGPKAEVDGGKAPVPVLVVGGYEWEMRGLEYFNNVIGLPVGLPKDDQRVLAGMRIYLDGARRDLLARLSKRGIDTNDQSQLDNALNLIKRNGGRTYESAEDAPALWFRISALNRTAALQLWDNYMEERVDRFLETAFPHRDMDLYKALQENYGDKFLVRLHDDPEEPRYYFQLRDNEKYISEWWIGTHQDELVRAFGSLVA